jgi:hypothetical protein
MADFISSLCSVLTSRPNGRKRRRSVRFELEALEGKALMSTNIAASVVESSGSQPADTAIGFSIDSSGTAAYSDLATTGMPTPISGSQNANVTAIASAQFGNTAYLFVVNNTSNQAKVYANSWSVTTAQPGGVWNGWGPVSSLSSDSALTISAVWANNTIGVFMVNSAHNTYYSYFNQTTDAWSGWGAVEATTSNDSAQISAIELNDGEPAIFRSDTSGGIGYDSFNGTSWSGWSTVASGAGATSISATNFNSTPIIFFTGSSGDVDYYSQTSSSPTWSSGSLPGITATQIAATTIYGSATVGYEPVITAVTSSGALESETLGSEGWTVQISSGVTYVAVAPLPNASGDPGHYVAYPL